MLWPRQGTVKRRLLHPQFTSDLFREDDRSSSEVDGELLAVSQLALYVDRRRGLPAELHGGLQVNCLRLFICRASGIFKERSERRNLQAQRMFAITTATSAYLRR